MSGAVRLSRWCRGAAHKLRVLSSAWDELGIDPTFGEKPTPDDAPRDVLRFPAG